MAYSFKIRKGQVFQIASRALIDLESEGDRRFATWRLTAILDGSERTFLLPINRSSAAASDGSFLLLLLDLLFFFLVDYDSDLLATLLSIERFSGAASDRH